MNGLVCVSLGTSSSHVLQALEKLDPAKEMAEIRVDLLTDYSTAIELIFKRAKALNISTIATVREIQADPGFSKTRSNLMKQCIDQGCTFVDVEVESPDDYREDIIKHAKALGVVVIVSHHNYEAVESSSENLDAVVEECFTKDADVAKVAVSVCSTQGASRVLSLYNSKRRVVALGMGEFGRITRVAVIPLGAQFSFAAWDKATATAPGQLTRDEMKSSLQLLGWTGDESKKKQRLTHL